MLTRRQVTAGLASLLAATPAAAQTGDAYDVYIENAFDDSTSMDEKSATTPFNKRKTNLLAWAAALESKEVEDAFKTLGPGGRALFGAYFWSNKVLGFIEPTVIQADNPRPALRKIAAILREEAKGPAPRLASGTSTSTAMEYGLGLLNAVAAHKTVLNIITDDDERETEDADLKKLASLQQRALQQFTTVNVLVIGDAYANRGYFSTHVKTGLASFVYSTADFASVEIAWRRKFCADIG